MVVSLNSRLESNKEEEKVRANERERGGEREAETARDRDRDRVAITQVKTSPAGFSRTVVRDFSHRFRAHREQLKKCQGLLSESQGQHQALTVLCVPHSLDSRCRTEIPSTVEHWTTTSGLVFKAHRLLYHSA